MSTGTVLFAWGSCGYKARVPETSAGRRIKCPGCQEAQPVPAADSQPKSARITRVAMTPEPFALTPDQMAALSSAVRSPAPPDAPPPAQVKPPSRSWSTSIRRTPRRLTTPLPSEPAPSGAAGPAPDGVVFTCSACQGRVVLPWHYLGRTILCPKCNAPQSVTDSETTSPAGPSTALSRRGAPDDPAEPILEGTVETLPVEPPSPFQSTPRPETGRVRRDGTGRLVHGGTRSASAGGTRHGTTEFHAVPAPNVDRAEALTRTETMPSPVEPIVQAPRWLWPLMAAMVVACLGLAVLAGLAFWTGASTAAALDRAMAERAAAEQQNRVAGEDLHLLRQHLDELQADLAVMRAKLASFEMPGSATVAAPAPATAAPASTGTTAVGVRGPGSITVPAPVIPARRPAGSATSAVSLPPAPAGPVTVGSAGRAAPPAGSATH